MCDQLRQADTIIRSSGEGWERKRNLWERKGKCFEENCTLLGYYAEISGNLLPTFRYKVLVTSSGLMNPKNKKKKP
jgi:hypothetical protein